MHTETYTTDIERFIARHRSRAYYALRATARTLIVTIPLIGGFIYNLI